MQGAGGFGSIARLIFEAGDRPRAALRSGQIVRANVIKQLGPSRWMLGIGGRVIAASAERALRPGMSFLAQVRIESGTVLLQPYEQVGGQEGALRFLGAEGLPRDELAVTILRALLRSGMPLDPTRIRAAYAFFKQRDNVSPRAVRAYLLMQQKGLDPGHEALDRFVDTLDGFGAGGGRGGGEREGGGERRKRREPRDPEEVVTEILDRRDEEPTELLHAFNHLQADDGHWIVVPFALEGEEGGAYRGSIRIRFSGDRPAFERAVVAVEGSTGSWELEIVRQGAVRGTTGGAGAGSRARLFYRPGAEPPADLLGDLRDRLSALGIGPVELEPAESFDGFSTDESLDILKGIDTEA